MSYFTVYKIEFYPYLLYILSWQLGVVLQYMNVF